MPQLMLTAGVDEVARGTLVGRVYSAAVIWNDEISHELLKDSKKLNFKQRHKVKEFILDNCIDYGIGFIDADRIDEVNILNATFEAMHLAIENLTIDVDKLLIDGNRFVTKPGMPMHECIVKGDAKFKSISAASILAKCAHDDYIGELAAEFPEYSFENNHGYGTKTHLEAIERYGVTKHHRRSFGPCR